MASCDFKSVFVYVALLVLVSNVEARPAVHYLIPVQDDASSSASPVVCPLGAKEELRLEPWGKDSIRMRIAALNGSGEEQPVQALLPGPDSVLPSRRHDPTADSAPCAVQNGNLRAAVDSSTGLVSFSRVSDGQLLLQEASHVLDSSPKLMGGTGSIRFASDSSEKVYGLGEHKTGLLNNKPIFLNFTTAGVYDIHQGGDIVLPFYLSNKGYGCLWNSASFGSFSATTDTIEWASIGTNLLDLWITTHATPDTRGPLVAPRDGPRPSIYKDMLSNFADVTGHPPELPAFASGFWQCKNRYRSQDELMAAARGYQQRNLTVSVIVVDYLHWSHFGDFSFNPKCWPDPSQMVKDLEEMGIRLMVSIWPFVQSASCHGPEYNSTGASVNFQPMFDQGLLVTDSATGRQAPVFHQPLWYNSSTSPMYVMDPYNPASRAYVWEQLKANYMAHGIKTFWLDEAEPERHWADIGIRYGYNKGQWTDAQVGLAWSREEQRMVYDGLRAEAIGADDTFMLSRSFFIGGARYGAGAWSGDIVSTFDSLFQQVRAGQNVAVSGLHWWTTDIGGFSGGDNDDPVYQQLIVRWFQWAAMLPIFRLHGDHKPELKNECGRTGSPDEVWTYGEKVYKIITKVMAFREELRPYVQATLAEANRTGVPAVRPMFLEFPDDPYLQDAGEEVSGQYMFGHTYLVSPVTKPNATTWDVYLPLLGSDEIWLDHFSGDVHSGGQWLVVDVTDLERFPLFEVSVPVPPVDALGEQRRAASGETQIQK